MITQTKTTWQKMKLGEIADFQYGYTASAQDANTGTKFLRITDIVPDLIDWETVPFCDVEEEKVNQYKVHKGDILIARTGATAGYAKLIRKEPEQSVFASYLIRLKIKDENVNPEFVGRIIESETFKQFVSTHIGGAAQPHANAPVLKNFEISIPPSPTQKQIADVLSTYDDLIENNTKRIKILEEMAQAIYREWFVYFRFPGHEKVKMVDSELGKIPEGWEVKKVKEICDQIMNGGTPRREVREYWLNGSIPWVTTSELRDQVIIGTTEEISKVGYENSSVKLLPQNTIIIALYASPTLGRLGLLKIEATTNQACSALVVKEEIGYSYLFYWLLNQREYLQGLAVGAAQQNINQEVIRELNVLIPDKQLLKRFQEVVSKVFDTLTSSRKENQKLAAMRDLLLPRLMSGKIRV